MPLLPSFWNRFRCGELAIVAAIACEGCLCCLAAADDRPEVIRFVAPERSPIAQVECNTLPTGDGQTAPPETQLGQPLSGDRVVKFVAPARLRKVRTDPRVQPVSTDSEAEPNQAAVNPRVIPTARIQTENGALPLPPVQYEGPPEVVNPLLDDPMQLTADVRPFRPISNLTVDISLPPGRMPGADLSVDAPPIGDSRLAAGWAPTDFTWVPTNMVHRPLYFEQVNLERYGYTVGPCLQPIVSGAHFFAVIPALPYKMTVRCPRDCVYTLGHYRPGDCGVPRRWHRPGWRWSAAAVEVGTVAGLILLIP